MASKKMKNRAPKVDEHFANNIIAITAVLLVLVLLLTGVVVKKTLFDKDLQIKA